MVIFAFLQFSRTDLVLILYLFKILPFKSTIFIYLIFLECFTVNIALTSIIYIFFSKWVVLHISYYTFLCCLNSLL